MTTYLTLGSWEVEVEVDWMALYFTTKANIPEEAMVVVVVEAVCVARLGSCVLLVVVN